jgi:preprotein translocase subunit SecG
MPVMLAIVVSIALVTAARLRRRSGAGATSLDGKNGRRWLSALIARGFSWPAIVQVAQV